MTAVITLNERQRTKIMAFLRTCPGIYVGNEEKTLRFLEAILWMVRSGAQWELLPERYGKWNSVYKRFVRWCERGSFEQMHGHFADDPDCECLLLDSTIMRVHPVRPVRRSRPAKRVPKPWGAAVGAWAPKSMLSSMP